MFSLHVGYIYIQYAQRESLLYIQYAQRESLLYIQYAQRESLLYILTLCMTLHYIYRPYTDRA